MKSRTFMITLFLLAISLLTLQAVAQQNGATHHHYKLIDLGTLGGPTSYQLDEEQSPTISGAGAVRLINARGMVIGAADLSAVDPYSPFCLGDCMLFHTFLWSGGQMTDLGALPSANDSFPGWINDKGEVVGSSYNGVDPVSGLPLLEAVLWKDGSVIDLGDLPGGNQSVANAINEHGVIVGGAVNNTPDPFPNVWFVAFFNNSTEIHAVRWRHGVVTDLGTLGGSDSFGMFVNEAGQIAGQSFTDSVVNVTTNQPTQHPFFWQKGQMVDLGSLGGTLGFPTRLNNRGQVIGVMTLAGDANFHPFLWEHGTLTDLGTLGGNSADAGWVTEDGTVLGISHLPGDVTWHGYVWKNGTMTDIGALGTDPCSDPQSINSRGQAVGKSTDCHGHPLHTFLWENGGPLVDLQSLVLPGTDVTVVDNLSINDRGEIAAEAVLASGENHSVVLIPCDDEHPGIEGCDFDTVSDVPLHEPGNGGVGIRSLSRVSHGRSSLTSRSPE